MNDNTNAENPTGQGPEGTQEPPVARPDRRTGRARMRRPAGASSGETTPAAEPTDTVAARAQAADAEAGEGRIEEGVAAMTGERPNDQSMLIDRLQEIVAGDEQVNPDFLAAELINAGVDRQGAPALLNAVRVDAPTIAAVVALIPERSDTQVPSGQEQMNPAEQQQAQAQLAALEQQAGQAAEAAGDGPETQAIREKLMQLKGWYDEKGKKWLITGGKAASITIMIAFLLIIWQLHMVGKLSGKKGR